MEDIWFWTEFRFAPSFKPLTFQQSKLQFLADIKVNTIHLITTEGGCRQQSQPARVHPPGPRLTTGNTGEGRRQQSPQVQVLPPNPEFTKLPPKAPWPAGTNPMPPKAPRPTQLIILRS
jgi:hypothetical protein